MIGEMDQAALVKRAAEAFFEVHTISYAIISNELKFIDGSKNFVESYAPESAQIKGLPLTDLLYEFVGAEDELRMILKGEKKLYQLDNVSRLEQEGETRYYSYTVQPIWPQFPVIGLLLVVEDITEIAQLQQQLVQERNELRLMRQKLDKANNELVELNDMKSLFLSMAAHDLRGPLTSLFGYADLLLEMDEVPQEMLERSLKTIRGQAERMHRLVDDILSLNQIEQHQLIITPQPFNLLEGVEEVTRSLSVIVGRDNLELSVEIPDPSPILWVDPGKCMQIIYNLLHNAAKYTPASGKIGVKAWTDGPNAVFEVTNSGPPLTTEQMRRLFTIFYRTEPAKTGRKTGTGLGLFIVKMLVEAQQGKIEVRSEAEIGTTFTVTLPLLQA